VQHPHDRHAGRLGAFDQRVLRRHVGRQVAFGEVGALAKGFLRIDHNQTDLHGLHPALKRWTVRQFSC
jgi:hypothetical protein